MKTNLIFDLDGTLWNTEKSYYYAFLKFFEKHPELSRYTSIDNVKLFKGITMDKMAPYLFPTLSKSDQEKSMLECLLYSCEYLKKEENVKVEVIDVVKKLSNSFNIYMVSNCPNEYVQIFFEKTSLKNYFKDIINLGGFTKTSDLDKGNNLNKIIEKHNLDKKNTYFIGDNDIDFISSKYAKINFIHLTYEMDNIENIILERIENQKILNLCDYTEEFRSFDASVTLMINNNQAEYKNLFGFLTLSKDEENNKKIFKSLEERAKELNIDSLVGPINYSTWFDYRLPIDNFDIKFIPDIKGTKEDIETLQTLGYKELYTYASTVSKVNKKLEFISNKNKLSKEYYDELIVGEKVFDYTKEIFEVSSKCFKEGFLYSDVPFNEFNDIYMKWLKKLPFDIDLYMIRKKETKELIAYGICYYDNYNKLYDCKTAAILKEHQKTNVVMELAKVVFQRTRYHNAEKILFHFQNEQKNTLSAFWRNHVVLKKRYALFIKHI